jgi:hypothetical protein
MAFSGFLAVYVPGERKYFQKQPTAAMHVK